MMTIAVQTDGFRGYSYISSVRRADLALLYHSQYLVQRLLFICHQCIRPASGR
ncbi:hypothetical protein D3C81_2158850 [compost metagenome]